MEVPLEQYLTPCYSCRTPFDAMDASWCSCVTKQRSLICPFCLNCFCGAPHPFVRSFWAEAPQELWTRWEDERAMRLSRHESPELRPLVLVVDDDPDVRAIATGTVSALGYGVVSADCAETALELTQLHRPDLVLSDALMPRVDGRELCQRIKKDPELSSTPVVIMSAIYKSGRYQAEARKTFGADAMIAKPLRVAQLSQVLQAILPPPGEAP